jgi:hypothetical protein
MLNKKATNDRSDRSMARNPEKYPNPTRFMPERHMSKVASEDTHGRDDISFAFGFGRRVWYVNKTPWINRVFTRNSVGRYVADASLFASIVNILAVFRVDRAPGWNVGPDGEGVKWTGGVTT